MSSYPQCSHGRMDPNFGCPDCQKIEEFQAAIASKDAALKMAVEALERCQIECNHLAHWDKKEFHKYGETCSAETAVNEALAACREALKGEA